jgi:hypothetical protein
VFACVYTGSEGPSNFLFFLGVSVTHMCTCVESEPEKEESDDEAIAGGEGSSTPLLKRKKKKLHSTMRALGPNVAAAAPIMSATNMYAGMWGPHQGAGMEVPYQGSNWMLPPGGHGCRLKEVGGYLHLWGSTCISRQCQMVTMDYSPP